MSFIYNNSIKYSDTPNLDGFGRLRISQNTSVLDIKHTYDKNPLLISEATGGTATSIYNKENARVRMSTSTNNDFVVRQSKTCPIYQPGKSQLFEASFNNLAIETNIIKRVGGFTSTTGTPYNTTFDGFFLESNGITNEISFQIWKSGTTIYSAATTVWDSSEIEVSTIDLTKSQLIFIDYQWLGVGRMRFGMVFDGKVYYLTDHTSTNTENTVYMSSANQPIRYEIRQNGVGSGYFDMICSSYSSEGPLVNGLYKITSIIHDTSTTLSTSGVKYPFIGFRLRESYRAANTDMINFNILNTSNDNYVGTVEFNPTLSSTPTWTVLENTPFEYSLQNGTPTVTVSGYILASIIGQAGTTAVSVLDVSENILQVGENVNGTRDEIWVCIKPLGANATFSGIANLKYYL